MRKRRQPAPPPTFDVSTRPDGWKGVPFEYHDPPAVKPVPPPKPVYIQRFNLCACPGEQFYYENCYLADFAASHNHQVSLDWYEKESICGACLQVKKHCMQIARPLKKETVHK